MDPASAIVAALVSGILAGVSRSAEELVSDTYNDLRSALLRRYAARDAPRLEHTVQWLEAEPTVPARQQALVAELHLVGADRDPYLLDLAGQLRAVIENPLQASNPVELAQRQAGLQVLGTVLQQHLDTVLDMRSRLPVDDTDLLSGAGSGGPVPAAVQDEVTRLHEKIRSIIEQVARRIEADKHRHTEEAVRTLPMAYIERERASAIVQADKRMHISYQTLRVVVEYFNEFNQNLLATIEGERAPGRLANLILGNAITVYELTQFVLEFIQRFRLDGYDDVNRMHREARQRLDAKRAKQLALAEQAAAPGIEGPVRDHVLDSVRDRDTAIVQLEHEWDKYLSEVESVRSKLGEVFDKVPTLEVIRDNARLQIDVMQEVAILRFLRMNADALQGTVSSLQGFRLAALTGSQVCRLVGVEERRG